MAVLSNRPVSFVVSVVFGIIGAVLILTAALLGSDGVFMAGVVAGIVSLIAALTWRSQLVSAWRAGRR